MNEAFNPLSHEGGYVTIQSWMVRSLGLSGRQLMIYAIIHSFSQDGKSYFHGGLKYLMYWTGYSKSQLLVNLQQMVKDGLLIKVDVPYKSADDGRKRPDSAHYCKYCTSISRLSAAGQPEIL